MSNPTQVFLDSLYEAVLKSIRSQVERPKAGFSQRMRDILYDAVWRPCVIPIVVDGMRKLLKLVPDRGRTFTKSDVLVCVDRTNYRRIGLTSARRDVIWLAFVKALFQADLYRSKAELQVDATRYTIAYTRRGLRIELLPTETVSPETKTAP